MPLSVMCRPGYIPSTTAYGLVECLVDLQETAARLLVVGGRLCFWLPDFTEDDERSHDDITHESSEQGSDAGTDLQAQVCLVLVILQRWSLSHVLAVLSALKRQRGRRGATNAFRMVATRYSEPLGSSNKRSKNCSKKRCMSKTLPQSTGQSFIFNMHCRSTAFLA